MPNPSPRPRVIYWLKQPTPYFVQRLNAVADREIIDLEVWFNTEREADRTWDVDPAQWRFKGSYVPPRADLGFRHRIPSDELLERRPDLFIQECDRWYLAAGFCAACATCRRTAFRALPSFDAWSTRTWWRETSKAFVHRAVDAVKVPGDSGRRQALRYGVPPSRVHEVRQSIDVDRFSRAREASPQWRARERIVRGLNGCVFLYVGRLWRGKGLDDLLEAYRRVAATGRPVSLLIVGDGHDDEHYRRLAGALRGVAFEGFVQPADLPRMYALGDVFVFPTLGDPNGLVVEEAMAAGLPVIATAAAGDIRRRVVEGATGHVVAPGDVDALARRMASLAADDDRRDRLGAVAARAASEFTPDAYAEDFERFVTSTLEAPPRRGMAAVASAAIGEVVLAGARVRRARRAHRARHERR